MPIMQQPPQTSAFDPSSAAPPPYSMNLMQTPAPNYAQPQMQPSGFPQDQMSQPMQQPQQFQSPQPQFAHPMQGQIPQQPYGQTPQAPGMPQQMPMGQQQFQGVQNMTPQQVQQVQQVINNLPPEKLQMVQQQVQQQMLPPAPMLNQPQFTPQQQNFQQSPPLQQPTPQKPHYTTTAPSGLFGGKHSSGGHGHGSGPQDSQKSDSVKRFFGDTLFGRVARSSVQTVTSVAKMPSSLSPWGDNNPVTLPNVRYRDAVLFTTFAFVGGPLVEGVADGVTSTFGADSFISEIVNSGAGAIAASTVLKYSVFQIVEQAIDKGIIEHMLPEEEKMLQTTSVKTLQVGIKHKLMGVDADLRFVGVQPARDQQACAKGWFCPYLFASARTPSIPRSNDFAIAQSFGPFLGGDYLLAHKLLSESTTTLSLCDPTPTTDIGTNRLLILFTAISPYRSLWSTSRRPGCGTLLFHLLNGCPALVIPVTRAAPITAWSPWTLAQMRAAQALAPSHPLSQNPQLKASSGIYTPEAQHEQICEYLDSIISVPHVNPAVQGRYAEVLGRCVSLIVNGALGLNEANPALGKVDPERAGICMLRY